MTLRYSSVLPPKVEECLAAAARALQAGGAKWMLTGHSAHALLDLNDWDADHRLTLITDKFVSFSSAPFFSTFFRWLLFLVRIGRWDSFEWTQSNRPWRQ